MGDSDFEGLILDPNNYEAEIKHIGIPRERAKNRNGDVTVAEQSMFRSDLGELMRIAQIARPGAIYDASVDARTFPDGK